MALPPNEDTALPQLKGPVMPPVSEGETKQLVVLCHGFGVNGYDLVTLVYPWQGYLADAAFATPHAPEGVQGQDGAFQWFGIGDAGPGRFDGIKGAAPILNAYIDQQLGRFGLSEDQLALAGFSQGSMMALYVGLTRPKPPRCIISFSGGIGHSGMLEGKITGPTPVLLVHGDRDPAIGPEAMEASAKFLDSQGVPVQTLLCRGIGHTISSDGVRVGGEFLVKHLLG